MKRERKKINNKKTKKKMKENNMIIACQFNIQKSLPIQNHILIYPRTHFLVGIKFLIY